MNPTLLVSRIEAAALCKVSLRTFDLKVRPVLTERRVGRRVLFSRSELERWADPPRVDAREIARTANPFAAGSRVERRRSDPNRRAYANAGVANFGRPRAGWRLRPPKGKRTKFSVVFTWGYREVERSCGTDDENTAKIIAVRLYDEHKRCNPDFEFRARPKETPLDIAIAMELQPLTPDEDAGVYCILGDQWCVKIGSSSNIKQRFRVLQTASAVPLRLLAILSYDVADEENIRAELSSGNALHGEWLRINEPIAKAVLVARGIA